MSKKNKQKPQGPSAQELQNLFDDSRERMHVTDLARQMLGMPAKRVISLGTMKLTEALPRYRVLGICIRGALFGFQNPTVKHMVDRNRELDEFAALERMAKAEGIA